MVTFLISFLLIGILCEENFLKEENKGKKRELDTGFAPIKIYVDNSHFYNNEDIEDEKKNVFNEALVKAKNTLEKLIKVQKNPSKIKISNYVTFPDKYENFASSRLNRSLLDDELDADLVILVREKRLNDNLANCKEKSQILAYNSDGRPIIGYIVINIDLWDTIVDDLDYKKEFYSYIFLHQFTHVLGFNATILGSRPNIEIIENYNRNRINSLNLNRRLIKSPKLIELAKNYFNCTENFMNDGIELEEKDSCDKDYIHWESRILLGDYMTAGIYIQDQAISNFTLSLLEDTDFYQVNYYSGDLMKFGKNQKCDFFKKDCNIVENNAKPTITFINEFCSGPTKTTCSSGRQSRGICDDFDFINSLSEEYKRNWDNYGNAFAEYCPISISDDEINIKKYNFIGNCKIGKKENYGKSSFEYWNSTKNFNFSIFSDSYGEIFSDISFCAFSSAIHITESEEKRKIYEGFIRPTCYQMFCSKKSLTILINTQYVVCPRKGGFINVGGNYTGHLLCPDYNLICSQTERCNNMFDCVEKHSEAKKDLVYDYTPLNVSSQILLPDKEIYYEKGYELSENINDEERKCPYKCSGCNLYSQCYDCSPDYNVYIGVREYDENPIICNLTGTAPSLFYYKKDSSDKEIYFRCIENCRRCSGSDKCQECKAEYKIVNNKCEERIEGCGIYNESSKFNDSKNNYYWGYEKCEECNETRGYYCIEENKTICVKKNKTEIELYYFHLTNGCVKKCEDEYPNCTSCDETHCTKCKSTHYLNNTYQCVENITNCKIHDTSKFPSECDTCKDNFYCLGENRTQCIIIPNIELYYNLSNKCFALCSEHIDYCLKCKLNECFECEEPYFVHNKNQCLKKLPHCLNHSYIDNKTLCDKCENNYHCVNENKSVCEYIEPQEFNSYYYLENPDVCVEKCRVSFPNCLRCNYSRCIDCKNYFEWETSERECIPDDAALNFDGSCSINIKEINKDLKNIDLADFADDYYKNFPSLNGIDHYVNKDYTITVFINSRCTEDLLNQGYFKIDSEELKALVKHQLHYDDPDRKLFYTIFVTHNFKSHFRYHNDKVKYIDMKTECESCINKEYTITNNYIRSVGEAFGPLVASLVESERINIFDRDSDVYSTNCQNITLLGIDMPQKERLSLLYPHEFSEQMACLGEKCEIEEFNFEESTCTCKCKMGNEFEDILNETLFSHYQGPAVEVNNFIDSVGIVKCLGNGFNSKNLKSNGGFFICLISIIAQIALYLYYILCSNPLVNLPKNKFLSNPPKRFIMLFSDWNKRNQKNIAEEEVFIQPRDDAEEQLLEEEKSYSNDDFNSSNISIGTNVEPVVNIKEKNKLKVSEKADKRILILLKNKAKGRKTQDAHGDSESDSEIINPQNNKGEISFCRIYWSVVSLKQHIINYFTFIHCCKITRSYIPLSLRIIRSLFLFILSFIFNILFLNQDYYEKKFNHFNEKYTLIHAESLDIKVSTGEKIAYAFSNTFTTSMISFILLIIINFIIGFIFFSIRKDVNDPTNSIEDLISKAKTKNNIFFIINMVLMVIFLLTITAFCGAYGGGFVDYVIAGIISLIFLEIFPFLWSLVISLLLYLGNKTNNNCCSKFGQFFMF